jgi:ABC-type glycerol-3-phosphate transport system substrate-binding protein
MRLATLALVAAALALAGCSGSPQQSASPTGDQCTTTITVGNGTENATSNETRGNATRAPACS